MDDETKDEDKQIIRRVYQIISVFSLPVLHADWGNSCSPLHALLLDSAKVTPFVPEKWSMWANSSKLEDVQGELRHRK